MKRARYDGPHDAVEVLLPDGTYETVERGHQLKSEVPAAFRDNLLAQESWTAVDQVTQKTDTTKSGKGG